MSVIDHAKFELDKINFGEEDTRVMLEILEKFFGQWDSGGAVAAVAPILWRLIDVKSLSPLTGEESEWIIHDFNDEMYAQNKRCSTVFKRRDGTAYDIQEGKKPVTFPYFPPTSQPL